MQKPTEPREIPIVPIWKNMSVEELAKAVNRSLGKSVNAASKWITNGEEELTMNLLLFR